MAQVPRHSPEPSVMSSAPFVRIAELSSHAGQSVVVRAWVTHVRSSGKIAFAVLRDGTGICQSVFVKSHLAPEVWARFAELTTETSVEITGEARGPRRYGPLRRWSRRVALLIRPRRHCAQRQIAQLFSSGF